MNRYNIFTAIALIIAIGMNTAIIYHMLKYGFFPLVIPAVPVWSGSLAFLYLRFVLKK